MPVFRVLGDRVLTRAEFVAQRSDAVILESTAEAHPLAESFAAPTEVDSAPGATQFEPIGPGRPLTILIRHVYTGKHPKTVLGGGRDMVVVTGLKDYATFAASSRAVNYLQKNIKPETNFGAPNVFTDGTNVVAYSPAVLTDSFHFTVEIAFDRFPDQLMNTISKGLGSLAGIPLMIPAQGYLLAASSLVKIGSDWADALVDGRAVFSITDSIDFNIPGVAPSAADFRVLANFDASGLRYVPGKGLVGADDKPYAGEEPYVVISLDGAARKNLEGFAPSIATAAVLKQFFSMRDGAEASIDAMISAFRLANDLKYRQEAKSLQAAIAVESDQKKKGELTARLEAVNKNILTTELKP